MKRLFVFLVFLSFVYSFSISELLYKNEKNASLNYLNFTYDGQNFSIVKIGQEEILLLKNDKVANETEINQSLTYYYDSLYSVKNQTWDLLKFHFQQFNNSRNLNPKFGKAEEVCLQETFLVFFPCNDTKSCMQTASAKCLPIPEFCSPSNLAPYILSYSKALNKMREGEKKFLDNFNKFNSASLDDLSSALDIMKAAATDIKASKILYPQTFSCQDCLGLCPEPLFNLTAINNAKSLISELKTNYSLFSSSKQKIGQIVNSTKARLAYAQAEEKWKIYSPKYNQTMKKYEGLYDKILQLKTIIKDESFVQLADSFLDKHSKIQLSVNTRSFENFLSLLESYDKDASALLEKINSSKKPYDDLILSKEKAEKALIELKWSVNNASQKSVQTYNQLLEKKAAIDKNITPPMTSQEYIKLKEQYDFFEVQVKNAISSADPLVIIFKFANSIGKSIIEFGVSTISFVFPINFATRKEIAPVLLPLFLGLVEVIFLVFVILLVLWLFRHFHRLFKNTFALSGLIIFFVLLFVLGLIGAFILYLVMVSSEQFITFSDFYSSVQKSDKVLILVNNASIKEIKDCGTKIETKLLSLNKTPVLYLFDGQNCKVGNNSSSVKSCLETMKDYPLIELKYESQKRPLFNTLLVNHAIFYGKENYYQECEIAKVLK